MEKYKVLLNTIGKMYPKTRFTFSEHGIKFDKQFYIDELLEIFDRFNEACEGKETPEENGNCIKPDVIKSVCPKCASEDVIWTCYCNRCQECM